MVKIAIIVGSTRPNRFGIQPAKWLYELAKSRTDAEFTLIDLEEVNLPFLDEPQSALTGVYAKDHTKQWSKTIDGFDGFVFVTQEYNHSYGAPLKNAIDFLYHEWASKPVAFVGYGAQAGGARAIEHLRGVVAQVKMFDIHEHMLFPSYYTNLDENGKYKFSDENKKTAEGMLDELVFWSGQMQTARKARA